MIYRRGTRIGVIAALTAAEPEARAEAAAKLAAVVKVRANPACPQLYADWSPPATLSQCHNASLIMQRHFRQLQPQRFP